MGILPFRKSVPLTTREILINNRKRLLNNETPFAIKEAYIKLRTSLMFCMTQDGGSVCWVFAVTSPNPSEGKSLTAANIAISFAMLGRRTLLIDADMRKPTQRLLWNVRTTSGLCDYLAAIRPLETARVEDLPLSLICTGTIPPNPSELLASDRMKRFVSGCSRDYAYIFIDTPPINTVADAQIVSAFVDGVILVAKSGGTGADELNTAISSVERAGGNLCGVVLNDVDIKAIRRSYRYDGRYGNQNAYMDSYGNK